MDYDDRMTRDYREISNRISESQKRRALEREEKLIKKNTKKKKVKRVVVTALAAAVIAGGAYAAGLPSYFDGQNKIVREFMDVTDEYAVSPTSEGFIIIHNGTYCHNSSEFNNMVEEMVEQAKAAGMNDNEIFIGLEKKISHVTAKYVYENQDLSVSDRWETCINNANTKTM
jgi:hypothetical protein